MMDGTIMIITEEINDNMLHWPNEIGDSIQKLMMGLHQADLLLAKRFKMKNLTS